MSFPIQKARPFAFIDCRWIGDAERAAIRLNGVGLAGADVEEVEEEVDVVVDV